MVKRKIRFICLARLLRFIVIVPNNISSIKTLSNGYSASNAKYPMQSLPQGS